MDEATYRETRNSLHGTAELLIAGPQYRRDGTIRLRVVLGGFGGARLPVSVVGASLIGPTGRVPLTGTYRQLAEAAGLEPGAPEGVYAESSGRGLDDEIRVDEKAAAVIADWFATGDAALRCLAPDVTPVLWPEHFDLSSTLDEVNFGVSPGDSSHPGPYAYVGPWTPRTGEFWNAPFGALRPRAQVGTVAGLLAFFEEGRDRAAAGE
ncbi:hypothetical protein SAMN04244553_1772 [Nocardia amikacinitolerans]|uniref:Uncharacterized protein n=1 Tax=Nocardia amikacinitolerans TaxID=756689 RepID=A0A285L988_9NOCA|nr:hypothetical protein [Nocardia amikacinitolerans]MCP2277771.1 hypothetical protein [Nocardia amikacinitolerans]MCP2297891.1 hypothetical protein [Nocardia amikacinitolerans]SNY79941.1 hypothetical protein SAMN04244553_1772 [Nocardia amikacinitolerans]